MNYDYSEIEYHLAREVLYLHSLWHRGPPSLNPNFSSHPHHHLPYHDPTFNPRPSFYNPNPYSHPNPSPSLCHNSSESSHLRPERSKKKQKRDSSPEKEWPCDPASVPEQSPPHTWDPFEEAEPRAAPSPNSAARSALISMQFSAIQSCKKFFSGDSDSESESGSESESESQKDLDEFFRDLFENDVGLRVCYENDHQLGEFYCLVCEARRNGKKGKGMMYRGCAALAQHANAVLKVGRRAAHQAFARAICRVLGWDPQRLPSIVLLPGSVANTNHSEDKKDTGANPIPSSTSNSSDMSKRDTNDWSLGPTVFPSMNPPTTSAETLAVALRWDPSNVPGTSANSPPEVVPEAGDSRTETIDFTGDRENRDGTKSKEAISSGKHSGSPVEEKKEGAL